MTDTSTFPDPIYRDTVLAPLFEGVKAHYAGHMNAINRAHLVMLAETGILSSDQARDIARALDAIAAETDLSALTYTGEQEDYFFLVEAELKARLGDPGGMLHAARSRNDMDHTLFKLALAERTDALTALMLDLAETLLAKARAERDTLIVAYTHGQPAQPSTYGHYLAAVLDVFLRDLARLQSEQETLGACPMGAGAITTSGFPIDRQRMADLLGFSAPTANAYASIAAVDYITGLYSALRLTMLHFGRVVQDLQFWSAFEVGQLYVPNSLVQISSIMPQKRNPVPIEHLRHLASVAMGQCDTIIGTLHNTPFTDMNDSEGEVQQAGYAAFERSARVVRLLGALIDASRINAERVQKTTDAACITITELADTLVRDEGLSFRQAHEIAAQIARAVIARGVPLSRGFDTFEQAFRDEVGRAASMSQSSFTTAVSPENFIAVRDRPGGPAPAALETAFAGYADAIASARTAHAANTTRRDTAAATLASAFRKVAS